MLGILITHVQSREKKIKVFSEKFWFLEFIIASMNQNKILSSTKIQQAFKIFDTVFNIEILCVLIEIRMEMGRFQEKSWRISWEDRLFLKTHGKIY